MKYLSTNDHTLRASLRTAVLQGMPTDGGLFMPANLPRIDASFMEDLPGMHFLDVSRYLADLFLAEDISASSLDRIVARSMDIDIHLEQLDDKLSVLETFHGPTMAFKDFGARFMAQIMAYLVRGEDQELTILVATSGDTGSAVAAGFLGVPGIRVIILYPSGKVSPSQEKQLTTQGQNITALEVDGSFDDCQRLVKSAFSDQELRHRLLLSSANSINIARLIPQSFYYAWAAGQLADQRGALQICVPSGNFGNITAALMAKRMGIRIEHLIAATNANAVFPEFLVSGEFRPRPSLQTMSNAMDVGNPSNLARIQYLFRNEPAKIRTTFASWSFSDEDTKAMMRRCYDEYAYIADPHTAVGLLGLEAFRGSQERHSGQGLVVSTAHPAKFPEQVEPVLDIKLEIPPQLAQYLEREKVAIPMTASYDDFKTYLLENLG